MDWIKIIFGDKTPPTPHSIHKTKRFRVKYVYNDILGLEYDWFCDATTKEMAETLFWEAYDRCDYEIISVKPVSQLNRKKD